MKRRPNGRVDGPDGRSGSAGAAHPGRARGNWLLGGARGSSVNAVIVSLLLVPCDGLVSAPRRGMRYRKPAGRASDAAPANLLRPSQSQRTVLFPCNGNDTSPDRSVRTSTWPIPTCVDYTAPLGHAAGHDPAHPEE